MARVGRRRKDQPWNPPAGGPDISTVFVVFAAGPLLLPVIGANADGIAFALASGAMLFAMVRGAGACRRARARRGAWLAFTLAVAIAASAAGLGAGASFAGLPLQLVFHFGTSMSVALVVGGALLARDALRAAPPERAVDPLLLGLVAFGASVYFIVVPGFATGDVILTSVFLLDAIAIVALSLATSASGGARRRMTLALLTSSVAIATGDALVALDAAGALAMPYAVVAMLWATGAIGVAYAAVLEDGSPAEPSIDPGDARWIYARVLAPLGAVLAFPLLAGIVWLAGAEKSWTLAYFGSGSIVIVLLAFARQAQLMVDNRLAMSRERDLREQMMRRNEDLEAVTGLATTMTETLEEQPIIERGLEVLHLAARSRSSALFDPAGRLLACAGEWNREGIWIDGVEPPRGGELASLRRGGRDIAGLPLAARGQDIGVTWVVRPESQPFVASELSLLRVLADQLAIAIQNARDYREKLEQAVRDPLTGVYNRRYFFEALEKEVRRARRYGSHASLVIFDVDDFKQINDTLGHAAGDDVLRRIAAIVSDVIRETDTFARIGGEEFALLLPQTQQLDALLVAERVRTTIARTDVLPDRRVTVSGGVASCPLDAMTREDLERKADAALYCAKRNGKNICALASEATEKAVEDDATGMFAHLTALVSALDGETLHTRDHSENVAAYAVAIAQELGLDQQRITRLRRAGLLHDIGKVAVPSELLYKNGDLAPEEYELVKLHAAAGATILRHAGLAEEAAWVRAHHERLDGSGYPDGLAGEEIPLESRILFVADSFEAMTSDRPYRGGTSVSAALEELRANAGTQFDPEVVAALERLIERGELDVLALRASKAERS